MDGTRRSSTQARAALKDQAERHIRVEEYQKI